jgi:hypothetical protein
MKPSGNARAVTILRAESHIVGPVFFGIPLFVAVLFAIAAGMMAFRQAQHSDIANMLTAGLEGGIPLALGIVFAAVTAREPALELQLTVATPYVVTIGRRFGLLLAWTALIELVAVLALGRFAPWALHRGGADALLTWLAPLLWFAALGALLALLMRSLAVAGTILGTVWVLQMAFHSYFSANGWTRPWYLFATLYTPQVTFWLINRLELTLTGLLAFAAVWFYLSISEWRFRGEDA